MKSISFSEDIFWFESRAELARMFGVEEIPDSVYRFCKTLRAAYYHGADVDYLYALWNAFFSPPEPCKSGQATVTYPEPEKPLSEAVRKAVDDVH